MNSLVIERLTVGEGRLVCEVKLGDPQVRFTSPEMMQVICREHPDLPNHTCVNDSDDTFAAVMDHTSLPHLLEHLVIDLQVRATWESPGGILERPVSQRLDPTSWGDREEWGDKGQRIDEAQRPDKGEALPFVGTTEWVDEAGGKALVEVSFTDDLVALRAFCDALRIINEAVVQ